MNRQVKLADNTISHNELELLCEWIKSGSRLTKDSLTDKFESEFAKRQGSKYAVFVNSGSSANSIATYALHISGRLQGRSIVMPAVSWVTTVSPAIQYGINVKLCDCNLKDLGLDLNHLEFLLKKGDVASVFVVHVLGHSDYIDDLLYLCNRYGVLLIEDACEALGTIDSNGKSLGSCGLIGTYSFYYGHQMSTIEGGVLITNDKEISDISRSLRAHGWSRDVGRDTARSWECQFGIDKVRQLYSFYFPGFNCRSTDLNAFIGIGQLEQLTEFVKIRQRNYERYSENLSSKYWVQKSSYNSLASLAFGTFVENREEVFDTLSNSGIESRPLICGSIGRQPFWAKLFGELSLPNADIVHQYGIYLPNHSNMSIDDVDYVCEVFNQVANPLLLKVS